MGRHNLILHIKKKWFDQIRYGIKTEEYRELKPYWISRIIRKAAELRGIVIICGYPSENTVDNTMNLPWKGYEIKTILNEEFGDQPTKVIAIRLEVPYVR
jgi:hypothetical protein